VAALNRRPLLPAALAIVAASCVGCGGDQTLPPDRGLGPTCTPMPSDPVVLEGNAAAFDLTGLAEPTGVGSEHGYLVINARADGMITDLAIEFQQMLMDGGFDIAGSDDEGFEAEVFFARETVQGSVAAGQVVLTESACTGLVDVKISVLDHPAVFPDDSETPPG
jgi:hypothetical protein